MAEAMLFAALRTPRGRGKCDGSLHEVKPVTLLAGLPRDEFIKPQTTRAALAARS
ncbi:MAG: acetyl-CoA C-acyltransferase, partial [Pseudomonadota bacterium]